MPDHRDPPTTQPAFGRRLRALRVARALSQAELGGSEFSAAYLSRLESGARPPTTRVLEHLCARLGVVPADFAPPVGSLLARVLAAVTTVHGSPRTAGELEEALRLDEEAGAALRWQAQWLLADCYHAEGRQDDELRLLRELVVLSDALDLPYTQARSRIRLARRLCAAGDLPEARAVAERAHALSLANRLPRQDMTEAALTLVSIDAEIGRLTEARNRADRLADSLDEVTENGIDGLLSKRLRLDVLWSAATVAMRQGDWEAAVGRLQSALGGMPSSEDPVLWLRLRLAAATMYLQMNPRRTDQAGRHLAELASAVAVVGTSSQYLELLLLQYRLAFYEGRVADARAIDARLGPRPEGMSHQHLVVLAALRNQMAFLDGNRTTAVAELERMAKEAHEAGTIELAAELWRALAESLAAKPQGA
ncbi:helix-turn-helix domain-containing protein [Streptomyces sp. NBC_00102]|uniref:helix-turn-helix domain-containing protein n=1 Tax=Streptomyces sp. NBC_00102 TaxID=2975652 RepID=UPI0022561A72|nr:helix-turn-helix domain-containing protein [Streptomyces sp. NBC_00102]MCX5400303.1 helix-turn-helix domain-containing protein [Streptomyces sp. NBC_00102]